jgi:hypothetical protein
MDIRTLHTRGEYYRNWSYPPLIAPKNWVGRSFFTSRSIEKWLEMMLDTPQLRLITLPQILDRWKNKKLIIQEECDTLKKMFDSPDQENWVIAITIMKQKAKQKKR